MISLPSRHSRITESPPADSSAPKRRLESLTRFLMRTVLGGVLFLIPLLLTVVILRQVIGLLARVLRPLAQLIPTEKLAGVVVADILAIAMIVLMCVGLGLFVGTRWGRWTATKLERGVLGKMPGYSLLKSATHSMTGIEASSDVHAALARIEDAWVPAFVMGHHVRSGLLTVFVPSSPTPTGGSIYFLPPDRVIMLNIPVSKVVSCIMKLGVNSSELLDAAAQDLSLSSAASMATTERLSKAATKSTES